MGLTHAFLNLKKNRKDRTSTRLKFLIDSGAEYSLVPSALLKKLGVEPYRTFEIVLADGRVLTRKGGDAFFEYLGQSGPSPVIFGEDGDEPLLGVVTLENLGLILDPLSRRISIRPYLRG